MLPPFVSMLQAGLAPLLLPDAATAAGAAAAASLPLVLKLLRTLRHPNLLAYYGGWMVREHEKIVFVTEIMLASRMLMVTSVGVRCDDSAAPIVARSDLIV
jgi:hypothetical protein